MSQVKRTRCPGARLALRGSAAFPLQGVSDAGCRTPGAARQWRTGKWPGGPLWQGVRGAGRAPNGAKRPARARRGTASPVACAPGWLRGALARTMGFRDDDARQGETRATERPWRSVERRPDHARGTTATRICQKLECDPFSTPLRPLYATRAARRGVFSCVRCSNTDWNVSRLGLNSYPTSSSRCTSEPALSPAAVSAVAGVSGSRVVSGGAEAVAARRRILRALAFSCA